MKSALYFGTDRVGGGTPNGAVRAVGSTGVLMVWDTVLKSSDQYLYKECV